MDLSQLKQLALPIVLLTLVGCASAPKFPDYVNQPSSELANRVGSADIGDAISLSNPNPLGLNTVVVDRTYFAASGRECRRLRDGNGMPIQRVACKGEDGQWRFARNLTPVSSSGVSTPAAALSGEISEPVVEQTLIPSAGSGLLLNNGGTVSQAASPDASLEPVITVDSMVDTTGASAEFIEADDAAYAIDLQTDSASGFVQRALNVNETLWSFAKRTTGNALNWKVIAETNHITDEKTLAPGAQLNIPVALVGDGG